MPKKGWQREPARHGLAAKGVKTRAPRPIKHSRMLSPQKHPLASKVENKLNDLGRSLLDLGEDATLLVDEELPFCPTCGTLTRKGVCPRCNPEQFIEEYQSQRTANARLKVIGLRTRTAATERWYKKSKTKKQIARRQKRLNRMKERLLKAEGKLKARIKKDKEVGKARVARAKSRAKKLKEEDTNEQ